MRRYARRPITATEAKVLVALLEENFRGQGVCDQQVKGIEASKGCECGCPTIDLFVHRESAAPSTASSPLPVEADVLDEAGEPIGGILIFLKDGYLSEMELYSYAREPSAEFPPPDRFRVTVRDG